MSWFSDNTASGQSTTTFNFNGSLGLHYDAYRFSESNHPSFRPRYPDNLGRISANATISAGRHFRMPFSLHITTGQNTYNLPSKPDEGFIDYIQNPRNNISINPSYRWIKSFIGTQTPVYSDLTTGDIALFGVGVELDPGDFLFSASYGKSQLGVEFDPANNIAGAYEQQLFTSRVGYGKPDGTKFVLHVVKATDDETSISTAPSGLRPAEGITVSPLMQLRLTEELIFRTEVAGSSFTNDLLGPDAPYDNEILDFMDAIMTINASSNADWANVTSIEWSRDRFTLGGEFRYVGPGFYSGGYRLLERDLIDYKINSDVRFLSNRLIINGSAGLRTNNLNDTTRDKTNRTIANLNVFGQITDDLSVNTNYANFGFRNNVTLDTLRVEMINHTVSVSPSYRFDTESLNHVLSGSLSYSHFDDFNLATGSFQNTISTSVNGNYQLVFESVPLNLGVMGMALNNNTPVTDIRIVNTGLNARYRLLERRLVPSVLFTYTNISRDQFTPDNRIRFTMKTTYEFTEYANFTASWNLSNYRYGSSRPDAATLENRFEFAIQTRF